MEKHFPPTFAGALPADSSWNSESLTLSVRVADKGVAMSLIHTKLIARLFLLSAFFLLNTVSVRVLAQTTAARPDRGLMPNGSYAVSDIEQISLTNGNLGLRIPLASLPPIAGGKLSLTINAHYNSKIWNVNRQEMIGDRYDGSNV